MKIDNSQGWTEVIIYQNCSINKFHSIADILQKTIDISFTNKISDTNSLYWDFSYKQKELTLHYNIFVGVSIFPTSLKEAKNNENQVVVDLSNTLSTYL